MSNEFIARKGLVAFKSSSFLESVYVSGSLSSPTEAKLTASWAVHASTASYIAKDFDRVYVSIGTGSRSVAVAGAWQGVEFHIDPVTASVWYHPTGSNSFECLETDVYTINLTSRIQKTAGSNNTAGLRILSNSTEIVGSYVSNTYTSNQIPATLDTMVTQKIESGSVISFEIGGSSLLLQTVDFPTFGATSSYTYSTKLTITRK